MKHFKGSEFCSEMEKIKYILEHKGYVLESDHPYAYAMQYQNAYDDVTEWLYDNGYEGTLRELGWFERGAVYGLYDELKISYEEMLQKLKEEARRQMDEEQMI